MPCDAPQLPAVLTRGLWRAVGVRGGECGARGTKHCVPYAHGRDDEGESCLSLGVHRPLLDSAALELQFWVRRMSRNALCSRHGPPFVTSCCARAVAACRWYARPRGIVPPAQAPTTVTPATSTRPQASEACACRLANPRVHTSCDRLRNEWTAPFDISSPARRPPRAPTFGRACETRRCPCTNARTFEDSGRSIFIDLPLLPSPRVPPLALAVVPHAGCCSS